jgi:hypothetical protein
MKAKLGKGGGDFAGLLALEPNPNPLADDLGDFPKAGSVGAE